MCMGMDLVHFMNRVDGVPEMLYVMQSHAIGNDLWHTKRVCSLSHILYQFQHGKGGTL